MSRSVLQKEAETNSNEVYREGLQKFLDKYPESKGYSFEFEAHPDGDNGVRAVIRVVYPDGHATPLGNIALESVPNIKQHLHKSGALKILYDGIKADTLAKLERVRISLGGKP